jgi:hypothetical protein
MTEYNSKKKRMKKAKLRTLSQKKDKHSYSGQSWCEWGGGRTNDVPSLMTKFGQISFGRISSKKIVDNRLVHTSIPCLRTTSVSE